MGPGASQAALSARSGLLGKKYTFSDFEKKRSYMEHAFIDPANHQDLSERPENLYLIESMAQELSNAVPDAS